MDVERRDASTAGGDEALLDDALALVRAAGTSGTIPTANVVAGMQHVFPIHAGAFPKASTAVTTIGDGILAQSR